MEPYTIMSAKNGSRINFFMEYIDFQPAERALI